jgi:Spy/CpxP family protein refolding chaperone
MSKWMNVTRLFVAVLVIDFCGSMLMAKDTNEPNKSQHKMREQQHPMKDPVEGRLEAMTKNLNLTKQQQDSIKPILQDQMKQIQALRTDKSITPEQRRTKMQEIGKETNAKIEAQLTPEQKEKFTKSQEAMKARRAEQAGERKMHDSNSPKNK